jgi:hypothetical protein
MESGLRSSSTATNKAYFAEQVFRSTTDRYYAILFLSIIQENAQYFPEGPSSKSFGVMKQEAPGPLWIRDFTMISMLNENESRDPCAANVAALAPRFPEVFQTLRRAIA